MPPTPYSRLIRFGVYEADLRSGELRKHGIRLRLQDQPFQVLCMLLDRPGELVTRDELRQRLWPADTFVDFDHGLNTAVNKLREVLGDSATNPRYIETLARRGYRFVGPTPVAFGNGAVPTVPEPTNVPASPTSATAAAPIVSNENPSAAAVASEDAEDLLPAPPRAVVRVLFALVQLLYLSFYILVLARLDEVYRLAYSLLPGRAHAVETVMLVTAGIGVPVRLYLLTAAAFDYRLLGRKFRRLFPLVLCLDFVFALSPYLIIHVLGTGLATAACAPLLYLPFSQRTLIRMGYRNF